MVINGQIYALRYPGCSEGRVMYGQRSLLVVIARRNNEVSRCKYVIVM